MSLSERRVCGDQWVKTLFSIYLVTKNEHKYIEARKVLNEYGINLAMAPIGKLEVQSDDLKEVAWRAALKAYSELKKPVVVDDSGLFIDELKGFPGVYSNYVYRTIGIEGILKLLKGVKNRKACFKTAIAAIVPPLDIIIEESVCGEIAEEPRGTGGFGYDPIFIPEGCKRTFAEMRVEEKNMYSHRAKAFRSLAKWLKEKFKL